MDRLEPDASDAENQAVRNRALRSQLRLSLPPEDQVVGVEIGHRPGVSSQGDPGPDELGPEGCPEDRAQQAGIAVTQKIPHRTSRIDHRTLGVVTNEPDVVLSIRGHHALDRGLRRLHPVHTP